MLGPIGTGRGAGQRGSGPWHGTRSRRGCGEITRGSNRLRLWLAEVGGARARRVGWRARAQSGLGPEARAGCVADRPWVGAGLTGV